MGIEMRIRAVLEGMEFPGGEMGVYALMVKAALGERVEVLQEGSGAEELRRERRWSHRVLREAGRLRVLPLGLGGEGQREAAIEEFVGWRGDALRWKEGTLGPVEVLWIHWMLVIGERVLGVEADRELLGQLWLHGFSEQQRDGRLLRWEVDAAIEGYVYQELTGIHAAYNSAKVMGDAGMMEQVRRVVRWHVENTQPDNTTNEPWGLAAFAALDETGTFAEQQLQDAVVQLRNGAVVEGRVPVGVGLLADALLTMEGR